MAEIYSVQENAWQECDTLGEKFEDGGANGNFGPIKIGANGAITENYWGDISCSSWYQTGGYPEESAAFSGNNGKDHWAICKFGKDSGRYINGVEKIKFYERVTSVAGHALYIFRYGVEICNDSGTKEMYDLSGKLSKPNGPGWHEKTFNSTLKNRLKDNNWHIHKLLVEVSTAGGIGTKDTQVSIEDLQFWIPKSSASNSGGLWKLIIPPRRPYAERSEMNRLS